MIVESVNKNKSKLKPIKSINLLGKTVNKDYKGLIVDIYEDASAKKEFSFNYVKYLK
ncbi:MAG: hypothetical protein CM15mP23_02500 [Cryomorphaceae bacterium]|nr:MAG: hypothetical protein CM15mP23_02500 [Cryomorphaceae bacterium]